ncbi:bifunctional (p)ppGpp synthetase/guanosine-3',5'-bis(diphosphate) 3'-pyrophosphohydrolase [Candidatus Kaiserbacteria bacterium]|nr:bifunctional (p)ppGpp synthetase/guanosine-3',5'-bis(diphosphate) 3'-pyrophosphohydrolase [Candidatus Kaiserbacteria bacterium]
METVKDILQKMGAPTEEDLALVERAYTFAAEAHKDHKRFSGEPYLVHLVATAKNLAELGMGAKTVAAGLLHDSIEDVGVAPETIEREFGKEIRFLVEGVTKLGRLKYRGAERHRESLRKLLVATGKDARVLIIKLMDRMHNMQTLQFVPPEKRVRIALETLEIYAAIAHRLGMGVVRRELEDLAFEHAFPEEFAATKKLLAGRAKETLERLEKMSRTLRREVAKEGMTGFHSDYRVKGLYSLWRKLKRKEGDLDKIYDIAALRIIVTDIPDCYRVLGIVNNLWQPLPNKIKDYIAFPKPNGYQSLHTTVFSGDGGIVEIQIRTADMHREAEYGITAHVLYKEFPSAKATEGHGRGTSFDWIKSLIPSFRRSGAVQKTAEDPKGEVKRARYGAQGGPEWLSDLTEESEDPDFEMTLKTDIFTARVFVFTPTGDVVDLPVSATPVDFAYAIHSDIGDHVFGAKVNGKLVALDSLLHNGDIVEIQTKKSALPKQKWLDFAKTTLARRHIRFAIEKETAAKSPQQRKK